MNNNYEEITEWDQFKEEIYEYVVDLLDEREEKKEKKKIESYRVYSSEDLDRLLSSNLPFEEKKALLSSERDRANILLSQLNEAETEINSSKNIVKRMKKAYNKILQDFKIQLPFTIGSITFSYISINELAKFLEKNSLSDLEPHQLVSSFIGVVVLPLLSALSSYYSINDLRNLIKYRKEINNCERRLKK